MQRVMRISVLVLVQRKKNPPRLRWMGLIISIVFEWNCSQLKMGHIKSANFSAVSKANRCENMHTNKCGGFLITVTVNFNGGAFENGVHHKRMVGKKNPEPTNKWMDDDFADEKNEMKLAAPR